MHALEAFITPITTFENTHNWYKITLATGLQSLSQVELVQAVIVKLVKKFINQLVIEGQSNLGLWANILRMKCRFQRGIMLFRFGNRWPNKLIK
jgi:hypothetical protein